MMKKKTKIICFCVVGLVLIGVIVGVVLWAQPKKEIAIYDKSGELIAKLQKNYELDQFKIPYCDVAISEATQIIAAKNECSLKEAKSLLWKNEYSIYTYFDNNVQTALYMACNPYNDRFDCGAAATDLEGNIVAAYGHGVKTDDVNYAMNLKSPYSAFKPLSVYMQAIEQNLIHWSSVYEDSAYKQIEASDGTKRDWPANANGEYKNADVTIYEAVRRSLNTVAVKCLKDVGVKNSISFLKEKFGMSLLSEQYTATIYDEEEIIGNIALGYLKEGVTPIDMAGYYQIFSNGGKYETPRAVDKICDAEGKDIYTRKYASKEVINPRTSDIMNKLLQGVTKTGGTGVEAYCENVEVAGKTGTGDGNQDNWFVGVTPEYSCAIWHSKNYKNMAPVLFSRTMNTVHLKNAKLKDNFGLHSSLKKYIYCEESGMAFSTNCTTVQKGYYVSGTELEKCNKH